MRCFDLGGKALARNSFNVISIAVGVKYWILRIKACPSHFITTAAALHDLNRPVLVCFVEGYQQWMGIPCYSGFSSWPVHGRKCKRGKRRTSPQWFWPPYTPSLYAPLFCYHFFFFFFFFLVLKWFLVRIRNYGASLIFCSVCHFGVNLWAPW